MLIGTKLFLKPSRVTIFSFIFITAFNIYGPSLAFQFFGRSVGAPFQKLLLFQYNTLSIVFRGRDAVGPIPGNILDAVLMGLSVLIWLFIIYFISSIISLLYNYWNKKIN